MTEEYDPSIGRDISGTGETGPLFSLGRLLATPGAIETCLKALVEPQDLLDRHVRGDWGDMHQDDLAANDHALRHGGRLFSAYNLPTRDRLWVITEADRSVTTILLPMEY